MVSRSSLPARFVRLAESDRLTITLRIDGVAATALAGDTLLVALLTHGRCVRDSDALAWQIAILFDGLF
ncbi:hypothetical protein DN412_41730 [Cupriavidus lacunae]|uniref:Uncharacterized protein n=1 Tax=Cupriavidus lacunae TaxID=2666307 RepID=A0A370MXM3_9BURK|nr:hypothetical protein DN412_41730 [Cupriavidus lacunae]